MSKKRRPEGPNEVAARVAQQEVKKEFKATFHQGPLPPPEQMEKYEQLWSGATEFFFNEFKKQTDHRQELERKVVDSNIAATKRGQWMAFILFLGIAVGGFSLLYIGESVSGLITALSGVGASLALFFTRRKKSDHSLYEKDKVS
jgi:uncharacterized membrane protein